MHRSSRRRMVLGLLGLSLLESACWTPHVPQSPHASPSLAPLGRVEASSNLGATEGQLIVGLKPGHDIDELPTLRGEKPSVTGALDFSIQLRMLKLPAGVSADMAISSYRQHPAVALLSSNERLHSVVEPSVNSYGLMAGWVPNDPQFPRQWALADGMTNARSLWRRNLSARNILVAVIDTGVDDTHPDLTGRILRGYNFRDGNADTMDRDGHGTHVAGIIAAQGNNGVGIAGVAWDAKILAVKVMDGKGGTNFAAISGIKYAVDHGAKVLNLSFTKPSPERNPLFDLAVQYALDHNVLVVAAAGNQHGAVSAPGNSPGALTVSALEDHQSGTLASYSNYGPEVFMTAPGTAILSTFPRGTYQSLSGTSMAAPMVSAAAAILLAEHPDWSIAQLKMALQQATDPLGTAPRTDSFGYGRLNLSKLP